MVLLAAGACGRFGFDGHTRDGAAAGDDAPPDVPALGCELTHPGALLCDGFEATGMGPWDYQIVMDGTATRTTTRPYRGTASLEIQSDSANAYKAARWGKNALFAAPPESDLYMRAYYFITSDTTITDQASILIVLNGGPPYPGANVLLVPGHLDLNVSASVTPITFDPPRDRWVCIELHVHVDATAGFGELSVDGAPVVQSQAGDTTVAGGYTNLDVGLHYATPPQGPVHMWIDDVVADVAPIGCN